MKYKFISYSLIESAISTANLLIDSEEHYYIGSISDLLYVLEMHKKGNVAIDSKRLIHGYEYINKLKDESGLVLFQDLDHNNLKTSLFNDMDLDLSIANKDISPRHSISRAVLKCSEFSFWDEEVYLEMEEWYENAESK